MSKLNPLGVKPPASDTFDKINKRELELGAAAMTALVYLLDNYKL